MDLGIVGPSPLGRRDRGFQPAVLDSSSFPAPPQESHEYGPIEGSPQDT